MVRGLLVLLSLMFLLYFSFLLQVVLNDYRFENKSFEKIDCGEISDSKSVYQTKAYTTWSDFFISDQYRYNLRQPDELESSSTTTSLVNGTLSCFCDQQA